MQNKPIRYKTNLDLTNFEVRLEVELPLSPILPVQNLFSLLKDTFYFTW